MTTAMLNPYSATAPRPLAFPVGTTRARSLVLLFEDRGDAVEAVSRISGVRSITMMSVDEYQMQRTTSGPLARIVRLLSDDHALAERLASFAPAGEGTVVIVGTGGAERELASKLLAAEGLCAIYRAGAWTNEIMLPSRTGAPRR